MGDNYVCRVAVNTSLNVTLPLELALDHELTQEIFHSVMLLLYIIEDEHHHPLIVAVEENQIRFDTLSNPRVFFSGAGSLLIV